MKYQIIAMLSALILVASCATESGEQMTDGGFKYKLINEGEGETPNENDFVFFHVNMMADNNEQFNSRDTGQESMIQLKEQPNANIITQAMQEILATASVGDSVVLMVPTDSLKNLGFPPGDTTKMLSYNIRITNIMDEDSYNNQVEAERIESETKAEEVRQRLPEIEQFVQETYRYIASGKAGDNIQETESGLQYIIHEEGTGEELDPGDIATVHYYGVLKSDGSMFDNSFQRGQEFQFKIGSGQVIRGWDEGLALLRGGSKATLIIPYEQAYGAAGRPPSIPEKADLIFYIEVPEE
ncbi:FKBP-type peptidyl-prolyl cis-trans isomerase [Portibacter marinus]|uniref:FKBP-type peptidyl-prolyl cis-trans isomerase n=1 Tax=Portibacter marinus TaxID=2898660 RepID=UPI001F4316AC|nr:FKBP-type peptidyl-prolyl cis-trans isomerase [Portibacter marinus]